MYKKIGIGIGCFIIVFAFVVIFLQYNANKDKKPLIPEIDTNNAGDLVDDNVSNEGVQMELSDMASINDNWGDFYSLANLTLERDQRITKVSGTLTNIKGQEKAIVKVDFYAEDRIIGSSSQEVIVPVSQEKSFEIKTLNNVASDDYKVSVYYMSS